MRRRCKIFITKIKVETVQEEVVKTYPNEVVTIVRT
jgi:hypothetical protein